MINKKAISPVVATALLLVVAVVAVVGFQNWFGAYSSGVFSDVEIKSNSGANGLSIEKLVGDIIYIINNIEDNLSIGELKIGGNLCTITNNLVLGMNEIPVSSCIGNLTTSTPDIVLITENNVVSKQVYVKDIAITSSLSQSDCDAIPGDWIIVPGSSTYGTSNFCVMKYEAKNVGGVATSQAAGTPWASITWQQAKLECENAGYHLITDNEWLTIARLVENDATNWNSSVVGTGGLFRGNVNLNDGISCGSNAVLDGNTAGTNCDISGGIHDGRNKRTLNISGNLIWDLTGNVWEWTDEWVYANSTLGSPYRYHGGDQGWMTYDNDGGLANALNVPLLKQPSNNWDADNGMGRYFDGNNLAGAYDDGTNCGPDYCHPTAVFLRGGGRSTVAHAGAFALSLTNGPSSPNMDIGFRCSYAP